MRPRATEIVFLEWRGVVWIVVETSLISTTTSPLSVAISLQTECTNTQNNMRPSTPDGQIREEGFPV